MHDKAVKVDADVVIAPFNKYYGKLKKKWKRVPSSLREDYLPQEDPFNKDTVGDTLLQLTTVTPWNKMFKRSFVMENELRFQETKIVNDAYFVVMALHLATRITYIDYVVANYRVFIKDSLTSSFSNNPTLGTDVYIYIGEELRRRGVFNERAYHNRVVGYLVYIFRRLSSNDAFIRELEYVRAESKKLSLEKHDKDFYFVSWHKEFVDRLLLDDKEEFMSYFRAKIFDDFTKQECHRRVLESDLDSITKELKKKEEALNKVMNSRSYKIGQMITFVPRKIVSFIKGKKRKT